MEVGRGYGKGEGSRAAIAVMIILSHYLIADTSVANFLQC